MAGLDPAIHEEPSRSEMDPRVKPGDDGILITELSEITDALDAGGASVSFASPDGQLHAMLPASSTHP